MKKPIFALLFVSLSACASVFEPQASGPSSAQLTQQVGDRFVGGPAQAMIARYGAPDSQQEMAGESVYSWRGTVTKQYSNGPETYTCKLDAYIRPDNTVRTIGFSGQLGGCDRFIP